MNIGDLLIAWSIRLALLLFFVALALQLNGRVGPRVGFGLKVLWTASFLFGLLHVVAAFHFVHHWSHNEAFVATAKETRQMLGFPYGAGVYFNYLFFGVWGFDVYWSWRTRGNVSGWQQWLVFGGRCYLLFIVFNGLVVFKSGWLRILGSVATIAIVGIAWRYISRRNLETYRDDKRESSG